MNTEMNTEMKREAIKLTKQDITPSYTYNQIIQLCEAQASTTLRIRYGTFTALVRLELKREVTRKNPIPPEYDLTVFEVLVPTALLNNKFKDWVGLVAEIVYYWTACREKNLAARFSYNRAYILWNFVRQSASYNSMKDDMTGKPWAHFD